MIEPSDKRHQQIPASWIRLELLHQVVRPHTARFLEAFPSLRGTRGLNIGNKNGVAGVQLTEIIGGEVINLEQPIAWNSDQDFDYAYLRFPLSEGQASSDLLNICFQSLKTDGSILVEDLNLNNLHCFPYSYAFERAMELCREMSRSGAKPMPTSSALEGLLTGAGFSEVRLQLVAPSFLKNENKHLASITLEGIAEQIVREKLTTQTEVQALISELRQYERSQRAMISLPGIFQVWGYKK